MKREDTIRMAREAGLATHVVVPDTVVDVFEKFARLVAAHEREKVAKWMVERSYATGHGDTIEDLLTEIDWQAAEREREGCASVAESYEPTCDTCPSGVANAIRARGKK
jgi:hypothetical protein